MSSFMLALVWLSATTSAQSETFATAAAEAGSSSRDTATVRLAEDTGAVISMAPEGARVARPKGAKRAKRQKGSSIEQLPGSGAVGATSARWSFPWKATAALLLVALPVAHYCASTLLPARERRRRSAEKAEAKQRMSIDRLARWQASTTVCGVDP